MEKSFWTQFGYIFLQGVIPLLDLPRNLRSPCHGEAALDLKNLLTVHVISEIKASPLSLWMLPNRPKQGIISFSRDFITSEDFSVLVG